jgi:hypothetical protein
MRLSIRIVVACCLGALALTAGCGRKIGNTLGIPNQPPVVRLTGSPPQTEGATQVARQMSWIGSDPDGRVDHYLVALNPRTVDQVDESWTAANETQRTIHMRRAQPTPLDPTGQAHRALTIFAVSAVDDRGANSAPAWQAMWGENLAPVVRIVSPVPTHLAVTSVPSQIRITWAGDDPDGAIPNRLAKYKFKLFVQGNSEFPIELAIQDPDSLRRFYAPGFAGWDSLPGDSLGNTYTNLVPSQNYLFVVTGFDANGDYDPIFSLDKNMLRMRVVAAGTGGPRITFYGDYFRLTSVNLEPPSVNADSRKPLTIHWSAETALGGGLPSFRWAVDITDLDGPPRRNPRDLAHWSERSPDNTSATIPPPPDGVLVRRLYVEAMDQNGLLTLTSLRIQYYRPTFARDLLIVDDTRLALDQVVNGALRPPIGPWPTAAELDSFLFARGGVPWRGYPAGTLSRPGLFAGYGFDTVGTYGSASHISADLLSQYRHVIWYVDAKAATIREQGGQSVTALRWMSRGRENALAAYVQAGGQLWLLGGGAGLASTIEWRAAGNITNTFSSARGELVPGQFMYDHPHWRSEFTYDLLTLSVVRATPSTRREERDFSRFPPSLDGRTPATDPLPPLRTSPSAFYAMSGAAEYLTQPNTILENPNDHSRRGSPLDTLYNLPNIGSGPGFPIMTFYHGRESGGVLFSGFDIWSFRRAQCSQLVDAVLQGIWGLSRVSGTPAPAQTEEAVVQRRGH